MAETRKIKNSRSFSSGMAKSDEMANYLFRMGQMRRLNEKEEAELGQTILRGRQEDATEEEKEAGLEAASRLAEANLGLVVAVAKSYKDKGLPLIDLISAGNLGLLHSARLFDYRVAKFSTYATRGITDEIRHALSANGTAIRIPEEKKAQAAEVIRVQKELEQKFGREPTPQEMEEHLPQFDADAIFSLTHLPFRVLSTDNPVSADKDAASIGDLIPDEDADVGEMLAKEEDNEIAHELLDALNEREKDVIRLSYGFDGAEPMSLADIGKKYKLSRERIRQIRETALHKMRVAWESKRG